MFKDLNLKKHITLVYFILIFFNVFGQESLHNHPSDLEKDRKSSLHIELVGRTFLFGSVNYEYFICKKFSIACGLGIISILNGNITRDNNGIPETGRYLDAGSTQMIYGTWFIGKKRHQLLFTGGLNHFLSLYYNKYPSGKEFTAESYLKWNAGIGYQYSLNKIFFRLTGYCISLPGPGAWFPEYLPWLGISVGVKL